MGSKFINENTNNQDNPTWSTSGISFSNDGLTVATGNGRNNDMGYDDINHKGAIKVYQYDENISNWVQKGNTFYSDPDVVSMIGSYDFYLSSDGNRLIYAYHLIYNPGYGILTFDWNGNSWVKKSFNLYFDFSYNATFSVSPDGNSLVVYGMNSFGNRRVMTFVSEDDRWKQIGQTLQFDTDTSQSVSISNNHSVLAVGDRTNSDYSLYSGKVTTYKFENGYWNEFATFYGKKDDRFGTKLQLSKDGKKLAITSPYSNTNGTEAGSINVYDLKIFNNPPTANTNRVLEVFENNATAIDTDEFGYDDDDDDLTYIITSLPLNGSISENNYEIKEIDLPYSSDGANLSYISTSDTATSDSFTFKVNDGTEDSNVATLSIIINPVNDAPTAEDLSISLDEDDSKEIVLKGQDVEGDNITYIIVKEPSDGTITLDESVATYSPNENYNGEDDFTYKVNDGLEDSEVATVSIIINPVNDVPKSENINISTTINRSVSSDFQHMMLIMMI